MSCRLRYEVAEFSTGPVHTPTLLPSDAAGSQCLFCHACLVIAASLQRRKRDTVRFCALDTGVPRPRTRAAPWVFRGGSLPSCRACVRKLWTESMPWCASDRPPRDIPAPHGTWPLWCPVLQAALTNVLCVGSWMDGVPEATVTCPLPAPGRCESHGSFRRRQCQSYLAYMPVNHGRPLP